MKNTFIICCLFGLMAGCSIDEEPVIDGNELTEINLVTEKEGCLIYSFDFAEAGEIEVRNFHDYLSVEITAKQDYELKRLNLHFAEKVEDFPLNKKGLIPGRMDFKYNFNEPTYETEISFPLSDFPENFLIAAYGEFQAPEDNHKSWAGDIAGQEGEWSYFEYEVDPFLFYAGTDQIREISLSEAQAIESWDEVRKLFAGMLDDGVNRTDGKYSPSIWSIIDDFNSPSRESQLGDYTTTYTLGSGECSDSVQLTLRVIED